MSRIHGVRATAVATLGAIGIASCLTAVAADKDGYSPDVSVAEIMDSMVMPAAQQLWDAVGVDVTAQGEIEKKPQNDDEWAQLRAAAVTLAEATNVLIVPGRHAAPAGTKSQNPGSELEPSEIEALLANERPAWVAHAEILHATAMQALGAVDARDIDKISEAGGAIDEACESCHLQFWYPEQK